MVDAQTVAEHLLQPLPYLHRQRYLGQEIEHLLVALQRLTDEMDIQLSLAARRYAAQQHHFLLEKLENNLVVCLLLHVGELLHLAGISLAAAVQSAHLLLVCGDEALVKQLLHHRRRTVCLVHQLLFRHLHDALVGTVTHKRVPV